MSDLIIRRSVPVPAQQRSRVRVRAAAVVRLSVLLVTTAVAAGAAHSPLAPRVAMAATMRAPMAADAFASAVQAQNNEGLMRTLALDVLVRERHAVVAAGPERVAAWVAACLLHDFTLVPGSGHPEPQGYSWDFRDSTGCYWRQRPGAETAPWPGADVNPAEGVLHLTLDGELVTALTLTYSDAWQARYLRSLAQPILAARAQGTADHALPVPTPSLALPPAPPAPDTQGRVTHSAGIWIVAAAGMVLSCLAALAATSRLSPDT
jgi:hypothetical protein